MKKLLLKSALVFTAVLLMAGLAYASGLHVMGQMGDLKVHVTTDSAPQAGKNLVTVRLFDRNGKPVTDALVRVYWMMPPMGTMPLMKGMADAERSGSEYRAVMNLEVSGEWHAMVKVKRAGKLLPPFKFDINAQ
ncbi:MAG: FixH family protein [Nitrospiraceae bacterium]|nr:FixH family protein [Nitrospiraceae bacterium]